MTRTFRMMNVLTLFAFMVATASIAAAQTAGPTTPAPPVQAQIDPYVVGQARPPVVEGSKLMELSLEQAQQIALERNLDLKVARMDPQSIDYQLQSARATFLPQ